MATQAQWWGWNGGNDWSNWNTWNNWNGAVRSAYPTGYPYYSGYAPASASQYHSQDELGQASFGYAHPGQAAVNHRDAFGNQVGSYAYINPEGKEVRVSYVADANGFRVLSNDLPVGPTADLTMPAPVQDTPEVAEAKAAHFAAVAAAKSGIVPAAPVMTAVDLPNPVMDTAEVAQAKKEHAAAWAAAKAAADAAPERKKRSLFGYGLPLTTPYAYPYASAPLAYPYASAPLSYSYATPYTYAAPAVPSMPVREATLTKTILNPGHAVAYRVD